MRIRITLLAALLLGTLSAGAMVYSTRDGRGAAHIDDVLKLREVLKDTVTVNGHKAKLQVGMARESMRSLIAGLQPLLQQARIASNATSLLIETPTDDADQLIRYYLMETGQRDRTLVFRMQLSKEAATARPEWPKALPRPAIVELQSVMAFDSQEMVQASFSVASSPAIFTQTYDNALRNDGWQPISGGAPLQGSAYLDAAGKKIVMVSALATPGGTRAAVWMTSLAAVRSD